MAIRQPTFQGEVQQVVGRVLAFGTAVDLHGRVDSRAGGEHDLGVERADGGRPRPIDLDDRCSARGCRCGGWRSASTMRRVIASAVHAQLRVHAGHDDVETGQDVVVLVEGAVLEDVHLDAGEDAERGQLLVECGDLVELGDGAVRGSSPWAMVRRGEWSVRTRYSWPTARAASAISAMGAPPSDQCEWQWQSPLMAARIARPSPRGTTELASRSRR